MNQLVAENVEKFYEEAKLCVAKYQQASVAMLQRKFRIGYTSAAVMIDKMEEEGLIGPYNGSTPRKIFMVDPVEEKSHETSIGYFQNPCPHCGRNDCYYVNKHTNYKQCYSCGKSDGDVAIESVEEETQSENEQIKQRLGTIKDDMCRGKMSFENMEWLVSTLDDFVRENK